MVTAFASIELAVEAMKLGATDFVRKPMTPDILRYTVAAALSNCLSPRLVAGASSEAPAPRIETVTMNGFHIMRTSAEEPTTSAHPGVHHYLVRDPKGQ